MDDMKCNKCGLTRDSGKGYGYACPHGNICGPWTYLQQPEPHTRPIIGQTATDAEKDATIARLTAELAEVEALELQHGAVIERLLAERDALIGAAYEAAARRYRFGGGVHGGYPIWAYSDDAEKALRSLTTAASTAALDRIKAEAELSGWERGRDDAAGGFTLHPWSWNGFEIREKIRALSPPADLAARIAKDGK